MKKNRKKFYKLVTLSITLFFASNCSASINNKNHVRLSSNSASCKYQANKTICDYTGEAKLNQETMALQAQKIRLYKTGNKLEKIVASGEDSSYSSGTDKKQQISASANLITLYPDENTMILEDNGKLTIGKDKYSGPYITYKFKEE